MHGRSGLEEKHEFSGGEDELGLMDGEENTGCGAGSETSQAGAPCAPLGRPPVEAVPAEVLGAQPAQAGEELGGRVWVCDVQTCKCCSSLGSTFHCVSSAL